jgi:uncharacterized RDD family membrane protein YckC
MNNCYEEASAFEAISDRAAALLIRRIPRFGGIGLISPKRFLIDGNVNMFVQPLLPISALSLQMRWTMLLERGLQNTSVNIKAAFLPSMAIDNFSFATLSAARHASKCRELVIYY